MVQDHLLLVPPMERTSITECFAHSQLLTTEKFPLWFAKTPAGSGINDVAAVACTGVLV